jgi:hypothetical protein
MLVLVLGLLLVALVPLAHATPPDPTWIPGIYDEADHDDAVGMLVDDGLALKHVVDSGGRPALTYARSLSPRTASLGTVSPFSPRPRSPPSS